METTCNINYAFGTGTANECTVQRWFKDFCKRDESLEDKGHSGRPLEVDKDPLRGPSKLILLQLCEKLLKNSTLTILWSFGLWGKLERWKCLISGCLMNWPQIKKNCRFEVSSSIILPHNNEPFLHFIMTCDEKWILYCYWWWTSSVVGLRRSSKALS